MGVNKIDSSKKANDGVSIVRYGSSTIYVSNVFDDELRDLNYEVNYHSGEWSAGTGIIIDSNGKTVFDNETYGGSLKNILISNNGDEVLHYSLNNQNPQLGSGTFPLATGVAVLLEDIEVTKLWCITENNTTILNAHGTF